MEEEKKKPVRCVYRRLSERAVFFTAVPCRIHTRALIFVLDVGEDVDVDWAAEYIVSAKVWVDASSIVTLP